MRGEARTCFRVVERAAAIVTHGHKLGVGSDQLLCWV